MTLADDVLLLVFVVVPVWIISGSVIAGLLVGLSMNILLDLVFEESRPRYRRHSEPHLRDRCRSRFRRHSWPPMNDTTESQ